MSPHIAIHTASMCQHIALIELPAYCESGRIRLSMCAEAQHFIKASQRVLARMAPEGVPTQRALWQTYKTRDSFEGLPGRMLKTRERSQPQRVVASRTPLQQRGANV